MSDIGSNWVKYDFLRQLFGKRAIRNTIEQRLARPNPVPYEYEKKKRIQMISLITLYGIIVKKFLRMSINAEEPVHILLIGPHSF
jgi:hypothetical protein